MNELHVVTGLPCSGKSTLCHELATALGGTAVIVGDLIRAAREESEIIARATQDAFEGREEYFPTWLAGLVSQAIRNSVGPVVLDGAAPLDQVLLILELKATSVLVVNTSDQVRVERFGRRSAAGARRDDLAEIFRRRTELHRASFHRLRGLVPAERVFTLAGDASVHDLLRQALAAIVVAGYATARPEFDRGWWPPEPRLGAWVAEAVRTAGSDGRVRAVERPAPPGNNPVLVFKPSREISGELVDAVLDRFAAAGYEPVAVAVWPSELIAASRVAPAHLELHYLLARWAQLLAQPAQGVRSAYSLLGPGRTAAELSAWWHGSPVPTRLARATWSKDDGSGTPVVNGHIPAMVEEWHRPGAVAVAVGLASGPSAQSWEKLRTDVLGHSDPAHAHPSSLRALAHRGHLPTREAVTLSANLLHLSAGPLEAVRERWLWLGGAGRETGDDLIDSPVPDGRWQYELTEHQSALPGAAVRRHAKHG